MKVPAKSLQDSAKILSSIKTDAFIFAGPLAYAVGQNISVSVLTPEIGTFGVSSEKFSQIAGRLDGEVDVKLLNGLGKEEVNESLISKIVMKGKSGKVTLPILASPEVPKIVLPPTAIATLAMTDFLAMITFAGSASETSNSFSYTGSVLVSSSGQKLSAVGTDGRRLAIVEKDFPAPQFSFIMPVQVIQAIKVLKSETISVYKDTTNLYFRSGGVTIVARQLAKDFPNAVAAIPKFFSMKNSFASQDLRDSLRRIAPLIDTDSGKFNLTISGINIKLNTTGESGSAEDEIASQSLESDPIFDTFNFRLTFKHIDEFISQVSGDVTLSATEEGRPILFECGERKLLCTSMKQ